MNITLLIAVAIILFIGILIFMMFRSGRADARKKEQALQSLLDRAVQDHGLQITREERFRNRIMALDAGRKKLVLVNGLPPRPEMHLLHLDKLTTCEIVNTYAGRTPGKSRMDTHVYKVDLEFRFRDEPTVVWTMYNELYDHSLDLGEYAARAQRWKQELAG